MEVRDLFRLGIDIQRGTETAELNKLPSRRKWDDHVKIYENVMQQENVICPITDSDARKR